MEHVAFAEKHLQKEDLARKPLPLALSYAPDQVVTSVHQRAVRLYFQAKKRAPKRLLTWTRSHLA